ncbi:carcinoembryonic antigen-related cell adhesion molecule 2-like [Hoplias malabaricus]|uniref:carcinoembryonic antigen-related cell adhesion molecule 2-like n=1 Tax=Hoplias malabaricus TaxID=27720 RepID=UPI0034618C39
MTKDNNYTGLPGATLNVTALELWMSSSSGDRTLKEGDSVNLTCAVNCTPSSPQFVWFKNGERLPESGPLRKTGSEKLVVTGCLSGHREEYLSRCIIKHTYKASVLHLRNLTVGDSGKYSCALKTDESVRSEPVQLNIGALELWMSSSSGDRTLKEGDSVNLTCAVNCTPSSPQFVWFKNGERLPESGSILHLLTLTVGDSGKYSCALKTDESVRSEPVQLNIGGSSLLLMFTALVIVGLMLFLLTLTVLAVIYKRRKKAKSQEENKGSGKKTQGEESTGGEQTEHLTDQVSPPTQTLPQERDQTYASINIDHKKPKKGKKTEAQEENRGSDKINQSDTLLQEGDVTYASVTIDHKKPKKGPSHPVQQQEDDSVIYSAVVTRSVK